MCYPGQLPVLNHFRDAIRRIWRLAILRTRGGTEKAYRGFATSWTKAVSATRDTHKKAQSYLASRIRQEMSLHQQMRLMLLVMSLVFIVGSYLIQSSVVMPTFSALERQEAIRDVTRCSAAVRRELELLGDLTNDWGARDDTYQYVQDRNLRFQNMNLTVESFSSARLSLIAILNADHELVWGKCFDPGSKEEIEMLKFWPVLTSSTFPLTHHRDPKDAKGGFLLTKKGPLMLHASPIVTSKREGPIQGSVLMGRFLDSREIGELANRTQMNLVIWPAGWSPMAEESDILDRIRESGAPVVREANSSFLEAFSSIEDVYGRPGLLLRAKVPRELTARGNLAAIVATWGSILGSLGVMAATGFLIRGRVVQPLEAVVAHAQHIGEASDLAARLNSGRPDEIGQLSRAFDRMVESLAVSRKKVLEAAHQAGMADVASEVLHNVGNVINSANASVEQLTDQLRSSKLEGLEKAAKLLEENTGRLGEFFSLDPRGPRLAAYLIRIASVLRHECTANQSRVDRVQKSMRHIQEIIALQESRAHQGSDFACETDLAETLRDIVALNQDRLDRARIEVKFHLEPLPELMLNRSKLTQVLVNLVRNAIQAMEGTAEGQRVLTLQARLAEDQNPEIDIGDSGCGMTDEVKTNLFRHGFTTKATGKGIGLHYCANAVRSMGGWISAHSEGPGRGSNIRIRFPNPSSSASQRIEHSQLAA